MSRPNDSPFFDRTGAFVPDVAIVAICGANEPKLNSGGFAVARIAVVGDWCEKGWRRADYWTEFFGGETVAFDQRGKPAGGMEGLGALFLEDAEGFFLVR
jgi:hypothetical protein